MSRFWSNKVKGLTPYVPGEQPKLSNLIKLNTNENPYGPSPRVIEALQSRADESLRLYPDPESECLKAALANHYNVKPDNVFVGNGSDEVLAHTFKALLKHDDPLLFPDVTYSFYPVYCRLFDIDFQTIPVMDDLAIGLEDYRQTNGGIIFPNPNAPTGLLTAVDSIRALLDVNTDSVVVVDEAYVDFGGESAVPLVGEYDNLLVVNTFSKSRSLAGLRVGFAIGDAQLIEALQRVKNSFNSYPLNRFAISGATASIEDNDYFEQMRTKVISTRTALVSSLEKLGFDVLPSAANFIFTRHPDRDAGLLFHSLRERSIIVRYFKQARIDQYLRITVGTDEQCDALINALEEFL